jgi:hypothetical protein
MYIRFSGSRRLVKLGHLRIFAFIPLLLNPQYQQPSRASQHQEPKNSNQHHAQRGPNPPNSSFKRNSRSTTRPNRSISTTNTHIPVPPRSATLNSQLPDQLREQDRRVLILDNPRTHSRALVQKTLNLRLRTRTPRIKRIAKLQRLLKLFIPECQRIVPPLRTIIRPLACALQACRDVFVEQHSHEDLVGCFGLVGGHLVAGLVDAREG